MTGSFVNLDCGVLIGTIKGTNQVRTVILYTPEDKNWVSLKLDYFRFKEAFTKKYGKPTSEYEFFRSPYGEGDGYELSAIKSDKCIYGSFWDLENGIIALSIGKDYTIKFIYEDKANTDIHSNKREAQISDDI